MTRAVAIRTWQLAVAFIFMASLAACESGPRILTNSAPDFSLVNYKTFGFFNPLDTDQGNVQSLISKQLIQSTTRELEMAGLRRVDSNPDLLVNFVLSSRETLQISSLQRGQRASWSRPLWHLERLEHERIHH